MIISGTSNGLSDWFTGDSPPKFLTRGTIDLKTSDNLPLGASQFTGIPVVEVRDVVELQVAALHALLVLRDVRVGAGPRLRLLWSVSR